jgi:hypothetical protein
VAPTERNEGLLFTVVTEHGNQQLRMMWAVVSPTLAVVNREEPDWHNAQ